MQSSADKKKKFILAVYALLFIFLLFNGDMRSIIRQKRELRNLGKKFVVAERENKELKKRLLSLENDPAYLEREARIRVGLVKPGEIKYKFVEKQQAGAAIQSGK
jgi:cell division protein FtsB